MREECGHAHGGGDAQWHGWQGSGGAVVEVTVGE